MNDPQQRIKILVSDKVTPEGLEILRHGGKYEVDYKPDIPPDELKRTLGEYDALVIRSGTQATTEVLENSGRLRVIGRAGVGVDNVDVAKATERGIIVMNTPGGNTISTAEHAISMLLAFMRHIPQADRTMKAGEWAKKAITGSELYGKTLGILGLGRIGVEVAVRMKAFGMKILGYDPFFTQAAAEKLGVELAEIDEICRRADVITVHTPLNKETEGLINRDRMALMKPTAVLVNCARGGIIDENDLIEALGNGKIAGAVLDVYREEPLPQDHPLRTLDNVVLSPHLAASTAEAQEKVTRDVARQVVEYLETGMARNAVNAPSVSPQDAERLRPVINLAERLGRFVSQYCPTPIERLEVIYAGSATDYPLQPITTAVVKGLLEMHCQQTINFVNALYIARSRGIEVAETKSTATMDYSGLITIVAHSAGGERNSISGTLFHGRDPKLVIVNEKHFDVTPEGNLIVIQNRDVPGIIGSVGTTLGEARINIADMTWGRTRHEGDAITVINVDDDVPAEVIEQLKSLPDILSVKLIRV